MPIYVVVFAMVCVLCAHCMTSDFSWASIMQDTLFTLEDTGSNSSTCIPTVRSYPQGPIPPDMDPQGLATAYIRDGLLFFWSDTTALRRAFAGASMKESVTLTQSTGGGMGITALSLSANNTLYFSDGSHIFALDGAVTATNAGNRRMVVQGHTNYSLFFLTSSSQFHSEVLVCWTNCTPDFSAIRMEVACTMADGTTKHIIDETTASGSSHSTCAVGRGIAFDDVSDRLFWVNGTSLELFGFTTGQRQSLVNFFTDGIPYSIALSYDRGRGTTSILRWATVAGILEAELPNTASTTAEQRVTVQYRENCSGLEATPLLVSQVTRMKTLIAEISI